MKLYFALLASIACLSACTTVPGPADDSAIVLGPYSSFTPGTMAEGAPPELMHWGKMVGQWSTVEEGLKPDGTG